MLKFNNKNIEEVANLDYTGKPGGVIEIDYNSDVALECVANVSDALFNKLITNYQEQFGDMKNPGYTIHMLMAMVRERAKDALAASQKNYDLYIAKRKKGEDAAPLWPKAAILASPKLSFDDWTVSMYMHCSHKITPMFKNIQVYHGTSIQFTFNKEVTVPVDVETSTFGYSASGNKRKLTLQKRGGKQISNEAKGKKTVNISGYPMFRLYYDDKATSLLLQTYSWHYTPQYENNSVVNVPESWHQEWKTVKVLNLTGKMSIEDTTKEFLQIHSKVKQKVDKQEAEDNTRKYDITLDYASIMNVQKYANVLANYVSLGKLASMSKERNEHSLVFANEDDFLYEAE